MAIQGKVNLYGGVEVNNVYIKVLNPFIMEIKNENGKSFSLHYEYHFKKDSNSVTFFGSREIVQGVDLNSNLYTQAYKHLADKLDVSDSEV